MSAFAVAVMFFALGGLAGSVVFGGGDSDKLDSRWGRGVILFAAVFLVGSVALELAR